MSSSGVRSGEKEGEEGAIIMCVEEKSVYRNVGRKRAIVLIIVGGGIRQAK